MGINPRVALRAAALASMLFAAQTFCLADDWPQWRGPKRDGAASFRPPKRWPEKLKLKWKVNVGFGVASPVTSGDRAYLFTNDGQREVVTAVSLADGRRLWQDSYAFSYVPRWSEGDHGKGPKATPALHGGRLFTVGVSGVISAYDASAGKLLWRKERKGGLRDAYSLFGMAISPLVVDDLVVAPVGGQQGKLTAFDTRTGEVRWQWGTENLHPNLGLGFSSPILAEVGGTRQIIFWTGRELFGLAPASGEQLWAFPFRSGTDSVVTPVFHDGTVMLSAIPLGTVAVRVSKRGDGWAAEQAWLQEEVFSYMSTPVAAHGRLYGLSVKKKGQYFCLDLKSGRTLWLTGGRETDNAAFLSAGRYLFVLTEDALLIVARSSAKDFDAIRRYQVADSPTWAHPVLLGRQILVKDAETLSLWSIEE